MRPTTPFLLAALAASALAACGPQATGTGTAALPGASAAPGTTPGASAAPGSTGGAAAGAVTDLATRFPYAGASRHLVYAYTTDFKKVKESGTEDITYSECGASSCKAFFSRTKADGSFERNRATEYPALSEGVILPVLPIFKNEALDLAAALKAGGTEEDVTVRAGRYKTTKVTYGGGKTYTWWIQKPWVVKATYTDPASGESATYELEKIE